MLTSLASFEAKVNYYVRTLNKSIRNEEMFPMFLAFNYNGVIRPRIECLREKSIKDLNLPEILACSDEEFCVKFDVESQMLESKKAMRVIKEEKDAMWQYVPGI
jgi:hypothetical protein